MEDIMSNATATKPAATVAPVADVPTADAFRAALAAASIAGDAQGAATATLASIALDRYKVHAARYVTDHKGVAVLPDSDRKNVAALVWLEATGSISAPKAADRTPGETSLGQYVSRMGTVATSLDYGMEYLAGVDSVALAYKSIGDAKRDTKTAAEDRAFVVFLGTEPAEVRAAFDLVASVMGTYGSGHRAAYVRSIPVIESDAAPVVDESLIPALTK